MNASALPALLARIHLPDMALVRQRLENETLDDVPRTVAEEAARIGLERCVRPGQSVAIAVGSRGIDRLAHVARSLCDLFRGLGARPFIVSAMGSHGGATSEGQTRVLADLGISELTMDTPLRIGLGTVRLGDSDLGMPVLVDAQAAEADHLVVVNRIKAHTKFKAPVESGLMKMLAVGLGNDEGARLLHGLAPVHGMYALIDAAARVILERGNLLCGVGLVENGLGRLHTLRLLPPNEIPEQEPRLLALAKRLAPKLPFDELDVLVVDEIGKDVSGTGMDTNVTGRNRDILGDFTSTPCIKRIFVRDLSPGTTGNALGIGFADVTTDRVARAMDREKTAINALTGLSPEKAALPLHLPTDRLALAATIHTLGAVSPEELRMVRIKNTKYLELLLVSSALLDHSTTSLEILHPPRGMDFIGEDLAPFPELNG
ncbi:nickel pincer cofactor-dependent isomerase, group 22 [Desulfonatronum thiodismutans]|uniref:lactate racemase domain-containing protein n=1 Tax=Desulfonatronum thiodismutans TaxID=159290 RepID=UPI0004DB7AE2|nr:lactate racemase domain-containing protein [Desulfonatronum thiodismutans]